MKTYATSSQPWQTEPTESMSSMLRRFMALDRPTVKQCIDMTGWYITPDITARLLYRDSTEIKNYEQVRKAMGLSQRRIETATVPVLAISYGDVQVRFCPICLTRGFHSSLFQLPWISHCPVHGRPLPISSPSCTNPIQQIG